MQRVCGYDTPFPLSHEKVRGARGRRCAGTHHSGIRLTGVAHAIVGNTSSSRLRTRPSQLYVPDMYKLVEAAVHVMEESK